MSNKTVNTFENGLVRVDNPTKQPKNSYPFAFNTVINNIVTDRTSRTNEKSFSLYYKPNGETNTTILGYIWLGTEEYVLFIKNLEGETAYNKIIYINPPKNITTVLYDSVLLNFQDNYEIKGTYRVNYKQQRIIYWVDGLNDDRLLNIDIDSTGLDISLLSLGDTANKPIIEATVQNTGGNITTGQYYIGISYNLEDSFTTSVLAITRPISIAVESYYNFFDGRTIDPYINRDFGLVDGDVISIPTNKSILIDFKGDGIFSTLDPNFTSYNLLIVKPLDDGTYVIRVIKNISITKDTYIYTGNEGEIDDSITLNDVIIGSIKYYASEAITQKENRLIRGNVKLAASQINYQEFANNITVTYGVSSSTVFEDDTIVNAAIDIDATTPHGFNVPYDAPRKHSISPSYLVNLGNNKNIADNRSFMRDAVYSFGVAFELADGTESAVFHIPGRLPDVIPGLGGKSGEYGRLYADDGTWDTGISPDGNEWWRDRNTATNTGYLSYWRSDEVYPDGYGYPTNGEQDSNGKSYIRHHRMPSDILEPLYNTIVGGDENATNTTTSYELNKNYIKLLFENIEIPTEYGDIIKKVKIYMTPRNESNKNILSKGLLQGTNQDSSFSPIEQTEQTSGGTQSGSREFEFISPEVAFKFKQTNLSGYKLRVCGLDKGFINYIGFVRDGTPGAAHFIYYFNSQVDAEFGRKQKICTSATSYLKRAIPKEEIYSRDLEKLIYIDNNFVGTSEGIALNFRQSQDTALLQLPVLTELLIKPTGDPTLLADYYPDLDYPAGSNAATVVMDGLKFNDDVEPIWQDKSCYDTSYYVSIVSNNNSLYGKVEDLEYSEIASITNTSAGNVSISCRNGDTYIDMHHYKKTWGEAIPLDRTLHAWNMHGAGFLQVYEWGSTMFGSFMCETDINLRMRREDSTLGLNGKYFPKSYILDSSDVNYNNANLHKECYKIDAPYNNHYIKYNFANQTKLDEFDLLNNGIRYSTRIIYSDKQSLEDKIDNYRISRANNYRDLPLNRGPITIFFTRQDKLYAITRDSLYDVFASNQTIKSENADNIVVGTGEFLSIEPTELISIDGGYGGTTSKFSLVESPYGYLFVDRHKNKCFLFNEQLEDINILGLNEYFKLDIYKQFPQLELENGFDNPINDIGIIATFDPELKRLIVTKKDFKLINTTGTLTFVNGYIYRNGVKLDYNDPDVFENKSFTASYDPISKKWISYHGYIPRLYIPHNTDFLIYNYDNDLLKSNGEGYDTEFIIETVFNENPLYTKVTDSLNVNAESFLGEQRLNDFFDTVLLYNDQQCTDVITLNGTNLTRKEKDWNINKFFDRSKEQSVKPLFSKSWNDIKNNYYVDKVVNPLAIDYNKPWYKLAKLRDKYLIVRFSYKNLEMKKIIVNFVNSIYKLSQR